MKFLVFLIWIIALIGLAGSGSLVKDEITQGNICPKLLGVPACYIILTCFVMVILSHAGWLKDHNRLFFVGAGMAWLIAATGTTGQIFGFLECPKTSGGIPMCYLSLAIFSILIVLKYILLSRNDQFL